jgi:hypothetical protein
MTTAAESSKDGSKRDIIDKVIAHTFPADTNNINNS